MEPSDGGGGGSGADDLVEATLGATGSEATGGATSDSGSGSGAADESGGGEAGLPDACGCRVADEESESCEELATTSCAGEVLCPELTRRCGRSSPDMYACNSEMVYDEAALECGLKALAAGAPGRLLTRSENTTCGLEGCGNDRFELTIAGPDLVVQSQCESNPIYAESSASSLRSLQPAAYFEQCLASPDPDDRWTCLFAGLGEATTICAPA